MWATLLIGGDIRTCTHARTSGGGHSEVVGEAAGRGSGGGLVQRVDALRGAPQVQGQWLGGAVVDDHGD